jgi:hypothetical protein
MFGGEDDEIAGLDRERGGAGGKGSKTVGVLERRANITIVGGEVVIGKDAKGSVKVGICVGPSLWLQWTLTPRGNLFFFFPRPSLTCSSRIRIGLTIL